MQELQKIIERLKKIEEFLGLDGSEMSAQEAKQLEAIKRDGIKALRYFNKVYISNTKKEGEANGWKFLRVAFNIE